MMRSINNCSVALRLHRCGMDHSLEAGFHSSSKVLIKRQIVNELDFNPEAKKSRRACDDAGFEEAKGVAPAPVTPPHENMPAADFARSYHSPTDTVLGGGYYPPGGPRLYRNMLEQQGGMDRAVAGGIAAVRIGPAQDPAAPDGIGLAQDLAAQDVLPPVEAPVEAHVDLPVEGPGEVLVEVLEAFLKL
jgi:hypothetical protein